MIRFLRQEMLDEVSCVHYNHITQLDTVTQLHDHDFCEVFLIAEGQVSHEANGKVQLLNAGSFMLIRPSDVHRYLPASDNRCAIMNLAFPTSLLYSALDLLEGHAEESPLIRGQPPLRHLPAHKAKEWQNTLNRFNLFSPGEGHMARQYAGKVVFKAVSECFLKEETAAKQQIPLWLSTLHEEMAKPENFTQGLPVMAALSGKSKEHMYRAFRRHYVMTPADYVNTLRIHYAANLLRNTDQPITDVALFCGYENLSYFYHQFSKYYGASPGKYRRESARSTLGLGNEPGPTEQIDSP